MIPALFAEDEDELEVKPSSYHIVLTAVIRGQIERYHLTSYYKDANSPCRWEEVGKEFIAPEQDVPAILEHVRRCYTIVGGSHYHSDYLSVEAVPL